MAANGGGMIRPRGEKHAQSMPKWIHNWWSIVGCGMVACGLTGVAFFLMVGAFNSSDRSGYVGLTFLPPLLVALVGAALIPLGIFRERWRARRGLRSSFANRWVLDPLGVLRSRRTSVIVGALVAGTLVVLGIGAGSLTMLEYTESNEFCGRTCHAVMSPEATVYADAAHSRIACVDCHVGHDSDSYIRAKLNGVRQIYAIATGAYQRPIPTPIHNGRPTRAICEGCHSPDRFIDYKAITRTYVLSGEENENVSLRMMLKVGGGTSGLIQGSGIHYHMLVAHKVEYIARDAERQDISWVRIIHPDGLVEEYNDREDPLSDAERVELEVHRMECLDCHSRPAHPFRAPVNSVNAAIAKGLVSMELPGIKAASVLALDGDYESTVEAIAGIDERMREFYEEEYPEALNEFSHELERSIEALRKIYQSTIFPEMKADWSAHPDNIGHRDSPGCFRCHNDEMADSDGRTIFTDCTKCHVILAQGEKIVKAMADFEKGRSFAHPEDSETVEEFTLCSDCHDGGAEVYE